MTILYKCSSRCTSIDELNFNGHCIYTGAIYNQIINALQPDNIEYIHSINILTKWTTTRRRGRDVPFMIKTIEFLTNRLLEEEEFMEFIHKMKEAGFSSNTNNNIQFINTSSVPHNILFDCIFSSELVVVVVNQQARRRNANNSSYGTEQIYKKTILKNQGV